MRAVLAPTLTLMTVMPALFAVYGFCSLYGELSPQYSFVLRTDTNRISNTFRAWQPAWLQDPMVAFSIYSGVTLTNATRFTTVTQGLEFIKQLLITFLLGFAIATGVSLLVLPITSRRNMFRDSFIYAKAVQNVLEKSIQFVRTAQDRFDQEEPSNWRKGLQPHSVQDIAWNTDSMKKSKELQAAMADLVRLHDKTRADLSLAESEVAWGKLDENDLHRLFQHLRSIMLPLAGISMLPEILQKLPNDWSQTDQTDTVQNHWTSFMQYLQQELEESTQLVMLSIQHAFLVLRIGNHKSIQQLEYNFELCPNGDLEKGAQTAVPGHPGFSSEFRHHINRFYARRQERSGAVPLAQSLAGAHLQLEPTFTTVARHGEESFKLLFLKHLVHDLLQGAASLVQFADSDIIKKHMERDRIIIPRKLFPFRASASSHNDPEFPEPVENNSMKEHRDPEHLPPANWFEKSGEHFGTILRILASQQSSFGFRAAAASFSVAILAFLHQTQSFFFEQRLIWILIVIIVGMSPTSGASLLGFANRIIGTIISFAFALAVWYIVVGHTSGVIVLLYIANMFGVSTPHFNTTLR